MTTTKSKPPTPQSDFADVTSLALDLLITDVLKANPAALTAYNTRWFRDHCDLRVRYLHANDPKWKKWLEGREPKIDPRDQIGVWLKHWLQAFIGGESDYRLKHPHDLFYA